MIFVHTYVIFVHTDVIFVHTDVIFVHTYVIFVHTHVIFVHTHVIFVHTYVIFVHTYVIFVHTYVIFGRFHSNLDIRHPLLKPSCFPQGGTAGCQGVSSTSPPTHTLLQILGKRINSKEERIVLLRSY